MTWTTLRCLKTESSRQPANNLNKLWEFRSRRAVVLRIVKDERLNGVFDALKRFTCCDLNLRSNLKINMRSTMPITRNAW